MSEPWIPSSVVVYGGFPSSLALLESLSISNVTKTEVRGTHVVLVKVRTAGYAVKTLSEEEKPLATRLPPTQ